ncbi:hypothetical protein [Pararhodobacter sp. CCB-MM2]|uniref:alpha/beta hydrolase family protein n=1 Tax=Pararhodobacter sp. CCB-MM2 TaxID=1786003 RepID=UPI00082CA92C|nr:hypothetical protein [Pararhodobacter sp. CCB-MM2]
MKINGLAAVFLTLAGLTLALPAQAEHGVGTPPPMSTQTPGIFALDIPGAGDNARALSLTLWFPAEPGTEADFAGNAVFRATRAIPGAAPRLPAADGRLPVVLISHGGLRSAEDSGAWLSAGLARAGYLAVEVNAPRPANARAALDEIWHRPADLTRALNRLLAHPQWAEKIDPQQVYAVGFALGGTATLALAGFGTRPDGYRQSCIQPGQGNPDCGWLNAAGVSPDGAEHAALEADRRDPRIRAAVAIAPEFLPVLTAPDASARPALVVTLGTEPLAGASDLPEGLALVALPEASAGDGFALCTEAGPGILASDGANAALCAGSAEARDAAHRAIIAASVAFLHEASAPR